MPASPETYRKRSRLVILVSLSLLFVVPSVMPIHAAGSGSAESTQAKVVESDDGGSVYEKQAVEKLRVEVEVAGETQLDRLLGGELSRNVELNLSVAEAREDDRLSVVRLRQLHARAEEEIARALEPFGYYRPTVLSELTQQDDGWTARYEIDPGPRMTVESVEVEVLGPGADEPGFRALVDSFPLEEGEPLSHPAYDAGKEALINYAAGNGYLDAEFEVAELRIDLERYVAGVELRQNTGPRYRFGEVIFHQDVLNREVIDGYIQFERGEPIDVDKLIKFQDDLSDSPYFRRVEVLVRPEESTDLEVPVHVEMAPSAQQKWDLGLGYGTDTGPRGTVAFDLRRVNRRGHRANSELTLSDIEQSFEARYLIPGAYPRTDVLTFSLGYNEKTTDTSTSTTEIAGIGRTQSRGRWREALGLTYRLTDFEVGLDSGPSELLVPEASWLRVKADDRIYPRAGLRFQVKFRGADESLVSDSSFFQTAIEAKAIRSLGDRLRVIGRLDMGDTWTSDFRRLPPDMRFFAGGDQSVRGYAYQQLGRLDDAGNVIGGEALFAASLEVDALFLDLGRFGRWGAAAFYDAGNASEELAENLKKGAGVGLRWLSPIGLVRADIAWALDETGSPARFHLMIGPDL